MVSLLIMAGLFVLSSGRRAEAAVSCSASDYKGTYGFYASGYFIQLPSSLASLQGRFAQAGTFTSDGAGTAKIQSMASYNGQIQPFDTTATYTVNSDCTLEFTLTLPPPLNLPATLEAVLSQNNGQMSAMITKPAGSTIISTHIKQYINSCTKSDLTGAYVIDLEGASPAVGPNPAGPFRRAGVLNADGAGHFSVNTLANYSGQPVTETFSGTYSVDSSCNVSLNYSYGTGGSSPVDISLSGALVGPGYDAMIMVTTSGWTVSGTLKALQQ
ncbi:MAG TPA: hypothetical protein VHA37_01595 [Candidatus Saccharimonadales bacterium]|nr:hypothetical protein [Candidatus Saccharimonadales bacterium]